MTGPSGATGVVGRPVHAISILGSNGDHSSITIGTDGLGLISSGHNGLSVYHCDNTECTSSRVSLVDTSRLAYSTSIAIGVDGRGLISYEHVGSATSTYELRVAHCDDLACTTAAISPVSTFSSLSPGANSIAIGADGRGLISFIGDDGTLNVAHCSNPECSSSIITQLEAASSGAPSITIGSDGLGIVAYSHSSNLRTAHCANAMCSTATITEHAEAVSSSRTSVVIAEDGLALVSYRGAGGLRIAHCSNIECTSVSSTLVDPDGLAFSSALTIGSDGLAQLAYWDSSAPSHTVIKLAHCSTADCTSVTRVVLDDCGGSDTCYLASVATGVDGLPLLSYLRLGTGLMVAHCGNRFCVPNHRPR